MRDIPADLLRSAYRTVDEAGFSGIRRDIAAVVAGQVAAAERERVLVHVDAARTALAEAGDGSPEGVRRNAAEVLDALRRAINSGEAA